MGEGFKRFKKKYFLSALLKAILSGLSAALLVVATFLLVIKFGKFDFDFVYSLLIGVAVGLLTGLILFFVLHLNDKGVAKKLDKTLGLKEKMQTMYAFREDDDELKVLQRQDAKAIIDSEPVNMKDIFKWLIAFIIVAVISLAYFVTSLVLYLDKEDADTGKNPDGTEQVTPPDEEKPEEEDPFEATDHHRIALEALIKEVEKSNLQDDAKTAVIAELTLLLANLDTLGTESQMKDYVIGVIKNVRGIVNTVNSTFAFHMYAKDSGNENVKRLSQALYSLDLNLIETELNGIRTGMFVSGSRDEIEYVKNELGSILQNSSVPKDDMLYTTVEALYNVLAGIGDNPSYSDTFVNSRLDQGFADALAGFKELVPQQRNNEEVKIMVVNELMRIFGITEADLEEKKDENGDIETEEPEERPEFGDDGGFGTGETVFGSDDIVIDPEKEPGNNIDSINVKYGEIISRYDAKITDMINNGEISEELAELLNEYFSILMTPNEN